MECIQDNMPIGQSEFILMCFAQTFISDKGKLGDIEVDVAKVIKTIEKDSSYWSKGTSSSSNNASSFMERSIH